MTLIEAVLSGDVEAVKQALKTARDLNQLGELGRTPLIEAARAGRVDLAKLLLDAGAEPMLKDDEQESALLKAAANGHRAVVELLLPLADDDERQLARSFLSAHGKSHGPEYQGPDERFGQLKEKAVELTARAAKFVGHDSPLERLERSQRAEKNRGKK